MTVNAREIDSDELADAVRIAVRFPWPGRRGLRLGDDDLAPGLARLELEHAFGRGSRVFVSGSSSPSGGRTTEAVMALSADDWASEHLGVCVERLSTISSTGSEEDRKACCDSLLCWDGPASEFGAELSVLRIDRDDSVTRAAALDQGFEHVDTEPVFLASPSTELAQGRWQGRPLADDPRQLSVHDGVTIRSWVAADFVAANPVATLRGYEQMLDRSSTFVGSHFGRDRRVPRNGCEAFYRSWTSNVLNGRWGDQLVTAFIDDELVGFYSWVHDRTIQQGFDRVVMNQSWSVTTRQGLGLFGLMLGSIDAELRAGTQRWYECETQLANKPVIAAFDRSPTATNARFTDVFHRWRRRG